MVLILLAAVALALLLIPSLFMGGLGDFPPHQLAWALSHHASLAAAYHADPLDPYPLPYSILFAPLGLLPSWPAHVLLVGVCVASLIASLWLTLDRQPSLSMIPALVAPSLLTVAAWPHLLAFVALDGLVLAAWAQSRDRWGLIGMGMAIAFLRPPNALPLACVLLVSGWGRWRCLGRAGATALGVLVGPTILAYAVDPGWMSHYAGNLGLTMYAGLPLVAIWWAGSWGLVVLTVGVAAFAAWTVRAYRGRPVPLDLAVFAVALGVLPSKLSGIYSGIYALPALARLGLRSDLGPAPWLVCLAAWLAVLILNIEMGSGVASAMLGATAYWFVAMAFPLVRTPPTPGSPARSWPGRA